MAEDVVMYIIGLGLGDKRDITLRGLEAVKKSKKYRWKLTRLSCHLVSLLMVFQVL